MYNTTLRYEEASIPEPRCIISPIKAPSLAEKVALSPLCGSMDAGTVDVEHQIDTNEGPLPTLIPTMTEEQLKELREELPPIIMMEFKDDTPILAVETQASIKQAITLFPEGPELPPLGNLLSEVSEGQFKPLYEGSLISEPPVPETGLDIDPGTNAIPQTPAVASALHGLSMQLISTNHHLINVGTQVNKGAAPP